MVWVTAGAGQKSQNGQFKVFKFVNFRAHKKIKVSKIYFVSRNFIK